MFVGCSFLFLAVGIVIGTHLRSAFFPEDVQYLAYVDVWLRNGAAISDTNTAAAEAEAVIRRTAATYGHEHPGKGGQPREILKSITSFVGGGGPRFWFSAASEAEQSNYAQLILEIYDKEDMPKLVGPLQIALSDNVPGAYLDVRQLLTNPVQYPIEVHVQGQADVDPADENTEIVALRDTADQVEDILRATPGALRVRTDWMEESPVVQLPINSDRANMAGVSNADIARSAAGGLSGWQVGSLLDGDIQVPIVARLRQEERARLTDVNNLYVYGTTGNNRVPIDSLAPMVFQMSEERIVRRDHFRTMTVTAFPAPGVLPSEVLSAALPKIDALRAELPPGFRILIGGEQANQEQAFGELAVVLAISVMMIFIALVAAVQQSDQTLAGVYRRTIRRRRRAGRAMADRDAVRLHGVSRRREPGRRDREPCNCALRVHRGAPGTRRGIDPGILDAGIERLRPVMVTVGATLLALFPLALHGGPLWRPLCFAQIGGLSLATVIELVLVKSFYAIFVADLGILKWGPRPVAHPE